MSIFSDVKVVLIDLDGTLVDSVPDLAFCIDEMQIKLGRQPFGEDKVRTWVGNGVARLVERALTDSMDDKPEKEIYDEAYPIFMDLYADNVCKRSTLYPGVIEGLDFLGQQAFKIGCVTNKAESFTLPLLEELGIKDRFEIIVSGDTCAKKKPDPMPLLHAAEYFKTAPVNCLLLGDSMNDVKAARAAGFKVICVPYGYNHGIDIHLSQPDEVIATLADIKGLV